ncbi:hypothetical protein L208DRAFT_1270853 [Tricholoma matsutake]|nr:hypothetical protein L208DRAFT_1270853 [Tricholoma matsutake 945]
MPSPLPKDKALLPIPWSADNLALTWCLIGLVEEPKNRKFVVGKGKSKNSSGESKAMVFKHITEKLIPEYFKADSMTFKHVKAKWD